jgi:HAD superfamily hydrolase (TIGR01509 family)
MSNTSFIKVAFFDLGGTLVGNNKDWIPGAHETLGKLSEKQIRLGVISNTADFLRPAILDLLPEDFDLGIFEEELIIFSSEVHVAKPDPEIFRLAIRRSGVKPAECLFCTEELSHILVAQQEGMQTVSVRKPPNSNIGELISMLVGRGLLPG